MRKTDATKIAGHLAGDMTRARVGDRGVLLESLLDAENTDFLRLVAGLAPFGEPGADFSWARAPEDRTMIQLDQRPFGIRLLAATPELLAQGLNFLAQSADRVLQAVALEYSRDADAPEPAYPHELHRRMRRLFATPPPGLPLGVRTHLDDVPPRPRLARNPFAMVANARHWRRHRRHTGIRAQSGSAGPSSCDLRQIAHER